MPPQRPVGAHNPEGGRHLQMQSSNQVATLYPAMLHRARRCRHCCARRPASINQFRFRAGGRGIATFAVILAILWESETHFAVVVEPDFNLTAINQPPEQKFISQG